jgi:hypothetical protein
VGHEQRNIGLGDVQAASARLSRVLAGHTLVHEPPPSVVGSIHDATSDVPVLACVTLIADLAELQLEPVFGFAGAEHDLEPERLELLQSRLEVLGLKIRERRAAR